MRLHPLPIALALVALCPTAASAQEAPAAETPTPSDEVELPQRYPPSSVRVKLIAGGLALTGLAYGAAALSGTQWSDAPGADALKVPIVGPWIALGQNECAADDPDCGFILYLRGFLTVVDGILQAGGLGIAGEGVFMTTEAEAPAEASTAAGLELRPVPMITPHSGGVGVVGRF